MADYLNSADCNTSAVNSGDCDSRSVCIDALRVYDSCSDKDCLNDLRVYFTNDDQCTIDTAVSVRLREAEVISVLTDLEPVPFHKGFYSVDMTFFFDVSLDVFKAPGSAPVSLNGLSIYNKKVILYGSEGSVKIFTSECSVDDIDIQNSPSKNLPRASVQVAKPIALSSKLCDCISLVNPPCRIPDKVCQCFGGEFVTSASRCVFVTIGMFSIVQIERNVQVMVPSYEFSIPEKECKTSSDNPCEVFSRLDFPTNEFFPPNVCDLGSDVSCGGCGRSQNCCD